MKPILKRVLNPGNIDFEGLRRMSDDEKLVYLREIYGGEYAKSWVQWAWWSNYIITSNIWQYVIARFILG